MLGRGGTGIRAEGSGGYLGARNSREARTISRGTLSGGSDCRPRPVLPSRAPSASDEIVGTARRSRDGRRCNNSAEEIATRRGRGPAAGAIGHSGSTPRAPTEYFGSRNSSLGGGWDPTLSANRWAGRSGHDRRWPKRTIPRAGQIAEPELDRFPPSHFHQSRFRVGHVGAI